MARFRTIGFGQAFWTGGRGRARAAAAIVSNRSFLDRRHETGRGASTNTGAEWPFETHRPCGYAECVGEAERRTAARLAAEEAARRQSERESEVVRARRRADEREQLQPLIADALRSLKAHGYPDARLIYTGREVFSWRRLWWVREQKAAWEIATGQAIDKESNYASDTPWFLLSDGRIHGLGGGQGYSVRPPSHEALQSGLRGLIARYA